MGCRRGNRISMTSTNSLGIPVLESLVTKHKRALNLAILHVFDLSSINVAISLTHSPHIFVTFLIPEYQALGSPESHCNLMSLPLPYWLLATVAILAKDYYPWVVCLAMKEKI